MSVQEADQLSDPFESPSAGVSRVPFRVYSDPEIYALEQERIFKGPIWKFLCLEIDVPNPGDFKTTFVGEVPVVRTNPLPMS
jgi:anthranilate 1,2-dioxygenase large subunit